MSHQYANPGGAYIVAFGSIIVGLAGMLYFAIRIVLILFRYIRRRVVNRKKQDAL